jgi:HEPN domain-containing protein
MQNKLPADKIWQEWMRKADNDELNAKVILKVREGTPNIVGVLSQQMAEKYLKGLLIFYKQDYPKIHDLVRIANLLEPFAPGVFELSEKLKLNELSELYIVDRYPSDIPELNWKQAENAFKTAQKIRNFVIDKITAKNQNAGE